MVSRSWWGEGTKSFFEESFVVKGSKRQNEEKERPSQTLMRSPEQVYSQPSHRCTFVTRTIIIHTSHRLRTAQTPFPPSMAGLTPSGDTTMAMALNYGCLHVCTGLRSTQHCAQSFNSPARRARGVTALARAQRPTARCYAIGRIEDCRSRADG